MEKTDEGQNKPHSQDRERKSRSFYLTLLIPGGFASIGTNTIGEGEDGGKEGIEEELPLVLLIAFHQTAGI